MTRRMLIDAAHSEETRIAVVDDHRLEDFDYEAAARKTLKGNIYLGKIARVEASLQAAFVEYGGNRHGFLPFADIHPDYYRLPLEDRQALIEEDAAARREEDLEGGDDEDGETADGADEQREERRRVARLRRQYKIQEVIRRRQIVLVQVSKEERGTKGAALTTYISLAGRYCVLMPNTGHGGGISRKITNATDRRKLKDIVEGLELPEGMAVIMRTAGVKRTKTEIRRDYDFLIRNWERIREDTLSSNAPQLIYEEADLIKRAIRDIYGRDIEEVLVEGDRAYRSAKDFMKALMPSHARRVQQYKDQSEPLFVAHNIETQLDSLHGSRVQLPSGGYLVIDSTEALVAVDVNSGRSTRERNIEETALKTNLEAATEVARQLRLRDLAGLIVIDFIDMDERRHNLQVERKLKEALKSDRARTHTGRISALGLLEMSRQRLRPSIFESSTVSCPHCQGSGFVRSVESSALQAARAIEQEALGGNHAALSAFLPTDTALYLLNQKRDLLRRLADEHGVEVLLERDDALPSGSWRFEGLLAKPKVEETPPAAEADADAEAVAEADGEDEDGAARRKRRSRRGGRRRRAGAEAEAVEGVESAASEDAEVAAEEAAEAPEGEAAEAAGEDAPKVRRRRRRTSRTAASDTAASDAAEAAQADDGAAEAPEEAPKPKRRRTRRKKEEEAPEAAAAEDAPAEAEPAPAEAAAEEAPKPRRRRTRRRREDGAEAAEAPAAPEPELALAEPEPAMAEEAAPQPAIAEPAEPQPEVAEPEPEVAEPQPEVEEPVAAAEAPRRRGWWRRQLDALG